MWQELGGEADPTMKLDAIAGHFGNDPGGVLLGRQRRKQGLGILPCEAGGMLDQPARGDECGLMVGDPVLQGLK